MVPAKISVATLKTAVAATSTSQLMTLCSCGNCSSIASPIGKSDGHWFERRVGPRFSERQRRSLCIVFEQPPSHTDLVMKRCPSCQSSLPTEYTHCPRDGSTLVTVTEWADGAVIRGKYRILAKVGKVGWHPSTRRCTRASTK